MILPLQFPLRVGSLKAIELEALPRRPFYKIRDIKIFQKLISKVVSLSVFLVLRIAKKIFHKGLE